jgi:hypothetical protein
MSGPVSKETPKVRIFGWWQKPGTEPLDLCEPAHAKRLVELKLAKGCMKGFGIQLRKPRGPVAKYRKFLLITIRGVSCKMGPRIIEGIMMGFYAGVLENYPTIHQGSYCPLVLRDGFTVDEPSCEASA